MKVKPSVKLLCNNCYFQRIDGKLRVGCKILKHKQRQGN